MLILWLLLSPVSLIFKSLKPPVSFMLGVQTIPMPTSNRWNANMNAIGCDSEGKQGGKEECDLAIGRAVSPLFNLVCTQGKVVGSDCSQAHSQPGQRWWNPTAILVSSVGTMSMLLGADDNTPKATETPKMNLPQVGHEDCWMVLWTFGGSQGGAAILLPHIIYVVSCSLYFTEQIYMFT